MDALLSRDPRWLRVGTSVFVAGSVLESALPFPEKYKKGKEKVSMLILGFYCVKKGWSDKGAVFHDSNYSGKLYLVLFQSTGVVVGRMATVQMHWS